MSKDGLKILIAQEIVPQKICKLTGLDYIPLVISFIRVINGVTLNGAKC